MIFHATHDYDIYIPTIPHHRQHVLHEPTVQDIEQEFLEKPKAWQVERFLQQGQWRAEASS